LRGQEKPARFLSFLFGTTADKELTFQTLEDHAFSFSPPFRGIPPPFLVMVNRIFFPFSQIQATVSCAAVFKDATLTLLFDLSCSSPETVLFPFL